MCRCEGGLDTCEDVGTCTLKPPPPPVMTRCQTCNRCINNVTIGFINSLSVNATPVAAATALNTWCRTTGRDAAHCSAVQKLISSSNLGNLARRPGALCTRLGECDAAVDTGCTISPPGTTLRGILDVCSQEGVAGGATLPGTFAGTGETISNYIWCL